MVRGVISDLKFLFVVFVIVGIIVDFLYLIIWKVIFILEVIFKLKVLFCICDGVLFNRRFFKFYVIDGELFIYKIVNLYDLIRYIYFISDVLYLIKIVRNCFSNFYLYIKLRFLWKDGKDILWMYIVRLYEEYCE